MNKVRIFLISIFLLLLPFLVYFLWPVSIDSGVSSRCRDVMPPMGGCFQSCVGYANLKCEYFGERSCIQSCSGQCYGLVVGTCIDHAQDKTNPREFKFAH